MICEGNITAKQVTLISTVVLLMSNLKVSYLSRFNMYFD